jgi:hypothetical protein
LDLDTLLFATERTSSSRDTSLRAAAARAPRPKRQRGRRKAVTKVLEPGLGLDMQQQPQRQQRSQQHETCTDEGVPCKGVLLRNHADKSPTYHQPFPNASLPAGPSALGSVRPRFALELYAGTARITGALHEVGLAVGPAFELSHGEAFDLHVPKVLAVVLHWIFTGLVWYVHLGTPCTPWSVATPSPEKHAELASRSLKATCMVIRACHRKGTYWTLENPWLSGLFTCHAVQRIRTLTQAALIRVDMCRFGAPFRKSTGFLGSLPNLASLGLRCQGGHTHERLAGRVWHWRSGARRLALAYSSGFTVRAHFL